MADRLNLLKSLRDWLTRWWSLREFQHLSDGAVTSNRHLEEEFALARWALDQGDRAQAHAIWSSARARFPTQTLLSDPGLMLFMRIGSPEEIEALIKEGLARYPREPMFAEAHAQFPALQGDPSEAIRRSLAAIRRFPGRPRAYRVACGALQSAGRNREAERLLKTASKKFSNDFYLRSQYARCAMVRHDSTEAITRWNRILKGMALAHEHWCEAVVGLVEAYREAGRLEDAWSTAKEAVAQFPEDDGLAESLTRVIETAQPHVSSAQA